LKNEDLQSVIDKAIAYDDKEVLEHLAQSKLLKTAGIMDTLRSMGRGLQLQTRGMGNESQFEDKSQLTTYLSSSSTMRDATESALVVKWWAESLKGLNNSITLSIPHPSSPVLMPLNVTFPNYVRLNDVLNIFDSLSNSDIKKEYPFFKNSGNIQSLIGPLMGTYSDANQVTAFNNLTSTPSGRVFAAPDGPGILRAGHALHTPWQTGTGFRASPAQQRKETPSCR
jgi:hypothetical protein